jgi:hypothetical protein
MSQGNRALLTARGTLSDRRGKIMFRTGVMKHSGGHVVPLVILACEFLNRRENVAEKIAGSVFGMATANVLNASEAELLIEGVSSFGETIRAEEHGIAWLKLQGEFTQFFDAIKLCRGVAETMAMSGGEKYTGKETASQEE